MTCERSVYFSNPGNSQVRGLHVINIKILYYDEII